jgi:hypothetical protein
MAGMVDRSPNWEGSLPRSQRWGGCNLCRHARPDNTCAPYPGGIPIIIGSGEVGHLVPRPGQVGDTVFELVSDPTPLQARLLRAAAKDGLPGAAEALAHAEATLVERR